VGLKCFLWGRNRSFKYYSHKLETSGWLSRYGYGLDGRGSIPGRKSLLHNVQTGSEANPASYSMGTGASFLGGKAAETWSWPLASNYCRVQEWCSYTSTPLYVFIACVQGQLYINFRLQRISCFLFVSGDYDSSLITHLNGNNTN
jgi:hypothetical protein